MAITVGGTNITMNDSTVQATAFLGGRATVFTATGTFTIPTGITAVKVTVVGGGGGGGQFATGAGAATAIKYLTGLTSGNTLSVTVGAAGAGVGAATSTGGNSSVASGTQTITTIQANGGVTPASINAVGTSATTSGADIAVNGGPSQVGSINASQVRASGSLYGTGGVGANTSGCTVYAGSAGTGYGAGGGSNSQGSGYAGTAGLVIFEY